MKQYILDKNHLIMKVKRASLFQRITLYIFSLLFFLIPIISFISSLILRKGLHMGSFVFLFLFSIMGYYLLRLALWNSFGKEEIIIHNNKIDYQADYGWFKGPQRSLETDIFLFSIRPIGFIDDHKGALTIGKENSKIECVTKMNSYELEELIRLLKHNFNQ